jgi:hypothetical protein
LRLNWPFLIVVLGSMLLFVGTIMWLLGVLGQYLVVLGLLTVGSLIGAGVTWVGRKLQIKIND